MTTFDAPAEILVQLTWWWDFMFRPRLDDLADEEFTWAPAPGAVSDVDSTPYGDAGPLTTIQWRMQHIAADVFGMRLATHLEPPLQTRAEYRGALRYPATCSETIFWLDDVYSRWITAVATLDDDAWETACGPEERRYADAPFGTLVLHIHREAIHHGAEILTLRDLYAAQ